MYNDAAETESAGWDTERYKSEFNYREDTRAAV